METYLVNLARRPDRLEAATAQFARTSLRPVRVDAVDGNQLTDIPGSWRGGRGAAGCQRSHLNILGDCLRRGVQDVLVFEDDVVLAEDFDAKLAEFMSAVPSDWQALLLGGQHDRPPVHVSPGVVRCMETGRTHCYRVRGPYIRTLYDLWSSASTHIDQTWKLTHATTPGIYAPDPFIAGQSAGTSDINTRVQRERWWQRRPRPAPRKSSATDSARIYPRKAHPHRPRPPAQVRLDQCGIVSHGGDLGDLIYALPTIRQLARDKPVELVLHRAEGVVREPWNENKVERVRSFLEAQPYIRAVRYAEHPEGVNLDQWRAHYRKRLSLAGMVAQAFRVPQWDRETPWAEVDYPLQEAEVVVHRSPRYWSQTFPWVEVMGVFRDRAIFVGGAEEHRAFEDEYGPIRYHPTPTLLDLARVIAGCRLFIGNQSTPRALAEALKRPVYVEECTRTPNTRHTRPTAWYGVEDWPRVPK